MIIAIIIVRVTIIAINCQLLQLIVNNFALYTKDVSRNYLTVMKYVKLKLLINANELKEG